TPRASVGRYFAPDLPTMRKHITLRHAAPPGEIPTYRRLITGFDVVVERINPRVGLDKAFAEAVEFREHMIVFHLLHGFPLLHAVGDDRASLFEHIDKLAQIGGSG